MINSQFYKRFFYYTLCIIPGLGFLIHHIKFAYFNVDEFQHTYLAWATTHFDMIQYRDMWDNHGILYTLFNSLILKIFQPEIGVPTIMLERYANLALLIIGFYILFEVFYELSSKLHYASLGVFFFAYSGPALKSIEVRPDNLQCVFLYASILLLFKALKTNNKQLSLVSGLFASLMLMTSLKSGIVLIGIGAGLVIGLLVKKDKKLFSLILNFGIGIITGLIIFAIGFTYYGILDDYIKYNVIFNRLMTNLNLGSGSFQTLISCYGGRFLLVTISIFIALGFFSRDAFNDFQKQKYQKLILVLIILFCLIARFKYYFWVQYDLLYYPICCFILSMMFLKLLELRQGKVLVLFVSSYLLLIGFVSFSILLNDFMIKKNYFSYIDKRFKDLNAYLKPNEYIDYFNIGNCPGLGFNRNLSFLIHKYRQTTFLLEKLEQREIFGPSYIKELNSKRVRIIIGSPDGIGDNIYPETKKYIFKNYKYYNCIWERVTPFR